MEGEPLNEMELGCHPMGINDGPDEDSVRGTMSSGEGALRFPTFFSD